MFCFANFPEVLSFDFISRTLLIIILGIHLAKKIDKMGMRCSDTAVIYFEDVRVPAKNIIGQEGYGFTYQMLQFQQERLACAALSLMPLERCIADTIGKIIFFKWVDFLKNRQIIFLPCLVNLADF